MSCRTHLGCDTPPGHRRRLFVRCCAILVLPLSISRLLRGIRLPSTRYAPSVALRGDVVVAAVGRVLGGGRGRLGVRLLRVEVLRGVVAVRVGVVRVWVGHCAPS